MPVTEEKRRELRERVTLFVDYEGADDLVSDFTENLSSGGTFVATNRDLPIGTQIKLVLSFPGLLEAIPIEGTVRWTRGHGDESAGAGIEFSPGPVRERLAALIEKIRARDPNTLSRMCRVLVVEDNKHVAALIQEGLRSATRRDFGGVSFVFRNAEDGAEALGLLRCETFDALLIDIFLPVIDGPTVIHKARTELGLTGLPIIAVSAGGDAARGLAMTAGANVFLDKPMRLRQLIDTMLQLLKAGSSAPARSTEP